MKRNDDVGYGKPPQNTRFQKGQSGNPKGRPKGTKNLGADLEEELAEQILIREGDVPKRLSKQRAMLKSLMAKAVKGDTRAANMVVKMVFRMLQEGASEEPEELTRDDRVILENYKTDVLGRDREKAQRKDAENPPMTLRKRLRLPEDKK